MTTTIDGDEVQNHWAGAGLKTNYILPHWQMGKASGGGSVTFPDESTSIRVIQLREPGAASSAEESRAFDDITEFDPDSSGRVRVHLSNITIDNSAFAMMFLEVTDAPDSASDTGDDRLSGRISGDGVIRLENSDDGATSFSNDTSQDNAFVAALDYVELRWDGSTATLEADDGSTTVTVNVSGNYPSGENLFLHVAARDSDASNARNVDFDVDAIEVGT